MARAERTSGKRHALPAASADRPLRGRFFLSCEKLIIELDGGHHNVDETARRDRERQLWLEQEGYRIIRFWNSEITGDPTAVLDRIYVELYGSREAEVAPLKHLRRR